MGSDELQGALDADEILDDLDNFEEFVDDEDWCQPPPQQKPTSKPRTAAEAGFATGFSLASLTDVFASLWKQYGASNSVPYDKPAKSKSAKVHGKIVEETRHGKEIPGTRVRKNTKPSLHQFAAQNYPPGGPWYNSEDNSTLAPLPSPLPLPADGEYSRDMARRRRIVEAEDQWFFQASQRRCKMSPSLSHPGEDDWNSYSLQRRRDSLTAPLAQAHDLLSSPVTSWLLPVALFRSSQAPQAISHSAVGDLPQRAEERPPSHQLRPAVGASPKVALCRRPGCGRRAFGGKPGNFCGQTCKDEGPPSRPSSRKPDDLPFAELGKDFIAFHGTSLDRALKIQEEGFQRSREGCLGEGIYFASAEKAEKFAIGRNRHAPAVIKCSIHVQRPKYVEGDDYTWRREGYDACRAEYTTWSPWPEWCIKSKDQLTVLDIRVLQT